MKGSEIIEAIKNGVDADVTTTGLLNGGFATTRIRVHLNPWDFNANWNYPRVNWAMGKRGKLLLVNASLSYDELMAEREKKIRK